MYKITINKNILNIFPYIYLIQLYMYRVVSCHLMGGLGNQLFQLFTTIAYSIQTKRNVVFPYSDVLTTGRTRNTYWESFLKGLISCTTINVNIGHTNESIYHFKRYNEIGFKYNKIPGFEDKELLLNGYFQSSVYFDNERHRIFDMIQLSQQKQMAIRQYPIVCEQSTHYISMHFRLGDYKNLPDCHPIMPIEYYKSAMFHISKLVKSADRQTVLYFCEQEDNEIVSNMIKILEGKFSTVKFIKVDDTIPDWIQMLIMSCCHDNIIANSSFSWWGGYFNENPDKMVCYPGKWFGTKITHDTSDLFPSSWKKIVW